MISTKRMHSIIILRLSPGTCIVNYEQKYPASTQQLIVSPLKFTQDTLTKSPANFKFEILH